MAVLSDTTDIFNFLSPIMEDQNLAAACQSTHSKLLCPKQS